MKELLAGKMLHWKMLRDQSMKGPNPLKMISSPKAHQLFKHFHGL